MGETIPRPIPLKEIFGVRFEPFSEIDRTIHLSDYEKCIDKNLLIPYRIHYDSNSKLFRYKYLVHWFHVARDPARHNYFGNVTFRISLDDVLDRFGSRVKMIYFETVKVGDNYVSRIFITRKPSHRFPTGLELDYNHKGNFPLHRDPNNNSYHHAVTCNGKFHSLEFIIDSIFFILPKWLYRHCQIIPTNHEQANTRKDGRYKKYACHKYNKFGKLCPTPFSKEEAHKCM